MFVLQPSLGTCESELVEVRFHFGSGVGTFFELFWDFYVRRVKNGATFVVQFRDSLQKVFGCGE